VVFSRRSASTAILCTLLVGVLAWFLRSPVKKGGPSTERYPSGRWRLAQFAELNRTVLWVSHVVILHKDSDALLGRRQLGWLPEVLPSRTSAAARNLAEQAFQEAQATPSSFASIAARYSDDVLTRSRGGSLGGVHAGQLVPEYLDALVTLKVGEVSRVFQTPYGFHIVKREPVPPAEEISGKRIVIGYRGSNGCRFNAMAERTRDDALRLADKIATRARAEEGAFDRLVTDFSECEDSKQQGDIGLRPVRDPGNLPREVERLSQLRIGEISEPMDSRFGYEVLLRTPPEPRRSFAMSYIAIVFEHDRNDERAKSAALQSIQTIVAELVVNPSRFDEFREKYCCKPIDQWWQGRGPLGAQPVLETLAIGEIAAAPIEAELGFFLPKRVAPVPSEQVSTPVFELPNPDGPDFVSIVQAGDGQMLARFSRRLATDTGLGLQLPKSDTSVVQERFEQLAVSFEKGNDGRQRVDAFLSTMNGLREQLGASKFGEFRHFMDSWGAKYVLDPTLRP
jgi:hypothetical protein